MARPKKAENEKATKESVSLTPAALGILNKFLAKYPNRNKSDLINAAVMFLEEQAVLGLDANCYPNNPQTYKDVLEKIAREGPLKKQANKRL